MPRLRNLIARLRGKPVERRGKDLGAGERKMPAVLPEIQPQKALPEAQLKKRRGLKKKGIYFNVGSPQFNEAKERLCSYTIAWPSDPNMHRDLKKYLGNILRMREKDLKRLYASKVHERSYVIEVDLGKGRGGFIPIETKSDIADRIFDAYTGREHMKRQRK